MNRRDFIAGASVAGLAAVLSAKADECKSAYPAGLPKLAPPPQPAKLNLCLQWGGIPASDEVDAKLDFLVENGFQAVETPSHLGWLRDKGLKVAEGAKKRGLLLATACGPSRFDYADKAKNNAEVEKFMPVLEILGEMKSVGLIICPARGNPEVGLKELREDFVTNTSPRRPPRAARRSCSSLSAAERRRFCARWPMARRWPRRSARAAR